MDFDNPAADFSCPATFAFDGVVLNLTCSACPEQYDVFKGDRQIGYLRLRHGSFRADLHECGGETVYTACPNGSGAFDNAGEREQHLRAAVVALKEALRSFAA